MGAESVNFTVVRSDYVLILSALVCALICAIGLAVVARCVCFHRRFNVSMARTRSHPPHPTPPPGLNKKLLEFLPACKYDCRIGVAADKQTECVVCLTEFADGDMTRILPQCGHVFHVPCIDTWLKTHSTCPSCRTVVLAVSRCRHCGQFTERQDLAVTGVGVREIDMNMVSTQDCAHRFLPYDSLLGNPIITT